MKLSETTWYRLETKSAVGAIIADDKGIIIATAPYFRRALYGQKVKDVYKLVKGFIEITEMK